MATAPTPSPNQAAAGPPATLTVEQQGGGSRWWENYLVRYLVPTAVGMACIHWLNVQSGGRLTGIVASGGVPLENMEPQHVFMWFLFGMVYCYLASYPVLVLHGTRMLDFVGRAGRLSPTWFWLTSYGGMLILLVLSGLGATYFPSIWLATALVAVFALAQGARICAVLLIYGSPGSSYEGRSWAYRFYEKLAGRRAGASKNQVSSGSLSPETRVELIESYRHLREHGNSAFIFVAELLLTALLYMAVTSSLKGDYSVLATLGALLGVWAAPAVGMHLLGQHLERQFSYFDDRSHR